MYRVARFRSVVSGDPDRLLARLAAFKMGVNTEAIAKMVADNEHNKYTML